MKIVLDIWIDDGLPQLALIDGDTGHVLHQWQLQKTTPSLPAPLPPKCVACKSLITTQQMIKKLFLLACRDNLAQSYDNGHCAHGTCRRSRASQHATQTWLTGLTTDLEFERQSARQQVSR